MILFRSKCVPFFFCQNIQTWSLSLSYSIVPPNIFLMFSLVFKLLSLDLLLLLLSTSRTLKEKMEVYKNIISSFYNVPDYPKVDGLKIPNTKRSIKILGTSSFYSEDSSLL